MGFPKILLSRIRRTKGTKVFYIRNYYGIAGVVITTLIGLGIRYTAIFDEFRKELAEGLYDNTPDYEWRRIYLTTPIAIPQTSAQLAEEKERLRTLPEPVIRMA
uniref:Uncharacterized protein n=1 Tax=Graphocephala atropunctata TaxID=36148 RepID=A0A1B6LR93_9HEMI